MQVIAVYVDLFQQGVAGFLQRLFWRKLVQISPANHELLISKEILRATFYELLAMNY